jgi:hypothetical protein
MAGGERERKGKRVEPMFNDPKRPKLSKAELSRLADVRSRLVSTEVFGSSFAYCPRDGKRLAGEMRQYPKCCRKYSKAQLPEAGPSSNACLLDARDLMSFWRRKIFWRLTPPFHSEVVWSTQPCVPLPAFLANFSEDWNEAAYKTYTVETHVKLLKTTRAVEDFCAFNLVKEGKGLGSATLLASGELLVIVPPL